MQDKLLNEIVSDIVGKQGSEILKLLIGKKDVNEFLIAKKLKLTINQVRNILYRLSNYSLVTFTRKKDKKKGWYTYFWTLDNEKALNLLEEKIQKETDNLKHQLRSREIKRFYFCKTCKTEISEETALLHNFICQECGEVYELADNKRIINELKNSMNRLERQRESVLLELNKTKEESEKKRSKEGKRFDRAKKKKSKKMREEKEMKKKGKKKKLGKKIKNKKIKKKKIKKKARKSKKLKIKKKKVKKKTRKLKKKKIKKKKR